MKRAVIFVVILVSAIVYIASCINEVYERREKNKLDNQAILTDIEVFNLPDYRYAEQLLRQNKKEYKTGGRFDSIVWYDGEIVMKPINDKEIGVFWEGKLIADRYVYLMSSNPDQQVMYHIGQQTQKWNLKRN